MPQKPTIKLTPSEHRSQAVVLLQFDYNLNLIDAVKKLGNAFWSATRQCWYIRKNDFNLNYIYSSLQEVAFIDYSKLKYNKAVPKVIKQAAKRAGIKKRVYPHILRHSFAPHNFEHGIDIRFIQEWLGHETIKTTERYTPISRNNYNFKNLIDDIL